MWCSVFLDSSLLIVLGHVFSLKPLLPLILYLSPPLSLFLCLALPLPFSLLCLFLPFSFTLSLDDRGELVLIPWDEQRHREMDWCEAEECR